MGIDAVLQVLCDMPGLGLTSGQKSLKTVTGIINVILTNKALLKYKPLTINKSS